MMKSLDDAIKHAEEVADGFDETAQEIAMQDENGVYQPRVSWYQDRASSQRQLAEWLRELKKYKELFDGKHGRIIDESQIKSVYYHEEPVMMKGFQLKNLVLQHTDAPTILKANLRDESSVEKDGMVTTECKMTNRDIAKLFHVKYPDMRIQDYRYLCHEMFTNDLYGITIWLENGDVIEYYPKEGKQNEI